jgi:hypothetical protein
LKRPWIGEATSSSSSVSFSKGICYKVFKKFIGLEDFVEVVDGINNEDYLLKFTLCFSYSTLNKFNY